MPDTDAQSLSMNQACFANLSQPFYLRMDHSAAAVHLRSLRVSYIPILNTATVSKIEVPSSLLILNTTTDSLRVPQMPDTERQTLREIRSQRGKNRRGNGRAGYLSKHRRTASLRDRKVNGECHFLNNTSYFHAFPAPYALIFCARLNTN